MIIRLWALAWVARYLKYVPILGWRFSETIVENIESRMERDVDIDEADITLTDDAPPTDVRVEIAISNQLPLDLTVSAVNLRIGYGEDDDTVANVLWSEDAHGSTPGNVSREMIESGTEKALRVERYLDGDPASGTLHVDGTVTTEAWLDVPSTKRMPLGELEREVPAKNFEFSS